MEQHFDYQKNWDDATAKIEYLHSEKGWIEGVMKYGMYSYCQILSLLYGIKSLSKKAERLIKEVVDV